jgi:hypothetical protein
VEGSHHVGMGRAGGQVLKLVSFTTGFVARVAFVAVQLPTDNSVPDRFCCVPVKLEPGRVSETKERAIENEVARKYENVKTKARDNTVRRRERWKRGNVSEKTGETRRERARRTIVNMRRIKAISVATW